ncbi:MAG: phosphotransferase [Chlorobi bacterium]|nr:phosphotransferase [Chlorobiota bacterium]
MRAEPLPPSGSNREYIRLFGPKMTAIGVYNPDSRENEAFLSFSEHFRKHGLPVPEIYESAPSDFIYLEEDLGNTTLFSYLTEVREQEGLTAEIGDIYRKVIDHLVRFQVEAGKSADFSVCYPRQAFDQQSMLWDLHYFKYYFLKLAKVPFDEQLLEDDFHRFADYLLQTGTDYFLYRDFQSRNIMLVKGEPYFIDYQGGRKGALQYDLASLLFDAKADLPESLRNELLEYYLERIGGIVKTGSEEFRQYFYGYVLIRIMQALGAYGFRGFYEQKAHFLQSIPFALQNLEYLLNKVRLPLDLPALHVVWERIVMNRKFRSFPEAYPGLTVRINSFSFKRGMPMDETGHGGGFVFDCRALPNPGKLEEYRELTGMDTEVAQFLDDRKEVNTFKSHVRALVSQSVENYLERNFKNLMINFGCTGGRHRSVYMAEDTVRFLKDHYPVTVVLRHLEQELEKE